jgi:regulator of nonsense transcripts 1
LFNEKNPYSKVETSIKNYGTLNESQISSIKSVFSNILNIIQGPPGTGKTFLSSFIVYNIFKMRKNESDKILLCSPSNSATDNLASSLLKINKVTGGKMKILRVFAKSREFLYIEDELLKVSLHSKLKEKLQVDDIYEIEKEELQDTIDEITAEADIVIATCSTSWDERISKLNFPFVIIDEVTQCCEIEALIPIVHGCQHLTLIGDQMQLGPIVLHPKAESTGMKVSLFERMLKLYPELLNLLNIQYRMHEEIVKFPSKEFYENKIINDSSIYTRKNEKITKMFNWPNKKIPLMFVDVMGKEIIIKSGKSKQNEEEAKIVALYIDKLKNLGINFSDIGIITPYAAQKILLHKKLKEKYKSEIQYLKISSVDGFQGREKDFIILSNVRSNENNNIGFLRDFRRLNVSITRAKYGMIIIGNAKCLYESNTIWTKYINYYLENDMLVQPQIKKDVQNDIEKIEYDIEKLEKSSINDESTKIESNIVYKEYDFDASKNEPGINEDLLNNFECSENVYAEGNKKYYKKKKEKKNKKKNKKKNYYYNNYNY